MFQGMFRKRGRPPDPPLQIGGYDKPTHEESEQIPAHQLREAPRQLPLPSVREFEQNAIMQQERSGLNNAVVESSSSQQVQQDVNMLDSQDRRLTIKPQHFGGGVEGDADSSTCSVALVDWLLRRCWQSHGIPEREGKTLNAVSLIACWRL